MEDKKIDYSRLYTLGNKINEFLETLPDGTLENPDFTIVLFAHDVKNKACGAYTLLEKDDERESLIQCIDNCITGAALHGEKENKYEWDILNGIAEYLMRLCSMFPELYENFKAGVENYIEKRNNEQKKEQAGSNS